MPVCVCVVGAAGVAEVEVVAIEEAEEDASLIAMAGVPRMVAGMHESQR
jgi:hypothetical protein